ncbi:unnamed protein product, partial [Rotaria sp. Silwood1]
AKESRKVVNRSDIEILINFDRNCNLAPHLEPIW